MPIQKRKIKIRKKPRKKVHPDILRHRRTCDDYYNRLQADPDDTTLAAILYELTGFDDPYLAVETIMRRTDCEIATLQINWPEYSFRCTMAYTDRTQKPHLGYIYPRKAVVKTSTRLIHSVMLAYIELCKHIGRFI